jgi:ADP-heptose:LPS heptosyltransferase
MRSGAKRAAALLVDGIVDAVSPMIVSGRAPTALPPHPRVLVVRCDHIGDVAMTTGVLAPLRSTLDPSCLDLLVGPWAAPLIEGHPAVNRVIPYATPWWLAARGAPWRERAAAWAGLPAMIRRLRAERYDVAIDLRGDLRQILFFLALARVPTRVSSDRTGGRRLLTHIARFDPARHTVEDMAAIVGTLGITVPAPAMLDLGPLPVLPDAIERRLAAHEGPGGLIVLALRGTDANREWPAERAGALIDAASEQMGLAAVVIGGAGERALAATVASRARAPVLDLTGALALREVAALCRRATVTVAIDSGPMHIAVAAGGRVVGLFGIGDPRRVGPWGPHTTIASTGAPCGCTPPACQYGPGAGRCMRELTPEAVLSAIRRVVPHHAVTR